MGIRLDLTDKTFGQLYVLREAARSLDQHRRSLWLCKCQCGTEIICMGGNLTSGTSQSCGCSRKINLLGQKFGRWSVLKEAGRHKYMVKWLCRCDCGVQKIIFGRNLTNGSSQSCGCYNKERLKICNSGPGNTSWKGGIAPIKTIIWKSAYYQKWRNSVFRRDNYTCQLCGDNKGRNLQGHHIFNFATFINLRFMLWNGITLCENCHSKTYGKESQFINQFLSITQERISCTLA